MQHLLGFIVRLFYLSCVTFKKIKQLCMVSMTNKIFKQPILCTSG